MVKRAKLTLEHTEVDELDFPETDINEHSVASSRRGNLGKILLMAGLTIVSLIIFKQKIF